VLKGFGFTENKFDPCLLSKWNEEGVDLDDCLVIVRDCPMAKQEGKTKRYTRRFSLEKLSVLN
jgi:hypothetical protein